MIDFVPSIPDGIHSRVPMDLSQYLLASSPPSFGIDFMKLSLQHSQSQHDLHSSQDDTNSDNCHMSSTASIDTRSCHFHSSFSHSISDHFRSQKANNNGLKPIIIYTDSYNCDSEGEISSDGPQSPGRTPKKVSFADHKGLALAHVRLVKESPDEPPKLDPKVLSLLTQGASADVTSHPPIRLCFPQPASDYVAFRDKVIQNLVSLENVILEDYTVRGTIKVKNITFEKRVFVRLSLDEWVSHQDYDSDYVSGPGNGFVEENDTFYFKIDIPPAFDASKKIQFAVCFEENGRQHWDNYEGANYCIETYNYDESEPFRPSSPPTVNRRWLPEKRSEASWSEFSVWRDVECSARYY